MVRGPSWRWLNQDGGFGNVGIVNLVNLPKKLVQVEWPHGSVNMYRIGKDRAYDLAIAPQAMAESENGDQTQPEPWL